MSVIVKAGKDICNSLTNHSTAKNMYSFSKAARFPEPKKFRPEHDFYELPSQKMSRFTKFGYPKSEGSRLKNKGTEEEENKGKEPEKIVEKRRGPCYTFSNGREKYGKVYLDTVKMFDKDIPGPGKYNYLKKFGSSAPAYTMRARNEKLGKGKDEKDKKEGEGGEENKLPEPYKVVVKITEKGKYPVSQIPNVNSLKFSYPLNKAKERQYEIKANPGPGTYETKPMIGQRIWDSRYFSYSGRTMLQKYNPKDSRSNYPGPGSYITPSEFGQYQGKDADQYPKENVWPTEDKNKDMDPKPWRHGMKVIKEKPPEEDNGGYDDNAVQGDDQDSGDNGYGNGSDEGSGEGKEGLGADEQAQNQEEKKEGEFPLFEEVIKSDYVGEYQPYDIE